MSTFLSDAPVLASDLRKLDTRLTSATGVQVDNAVAALVDSAPEALDTLNELAAALGDDANFATTVTNSLAGKADAFTVGTGLTLSGGVLTADVTQGEVDNKHPVISSTNRLDASLVGTGVVSDAEYACLDGCTSSIQTQLGGKMASFTAGDGLSFTSSVLHAEATQAKLDLKHDTISASNRLDTSLVGDGSVSNAELAYLNGTTGPIQGQLDGLQPMITAGDGLAFSGNTLNADVTTAHLATKHDLISASNRLGASLVGDGSVSNAELAYLNGASANLQGQLDGKQAAITAGDGLAFAGNTLNAEVTTASLATKQDVITGAATTLTGSNLTSNHALVSNGNGKVVVSTVTSTELGYLDGLTSNLQAQLNLLKPSACKMYRSSNQSLSSNTGTTMTYNTKEYTFGSHVTGNTGNGRFTCSQTGNYVYSGNVLISSGGTGARVIINVKLNGNFIYNNRGGKPVDGDLDNFRAGCFAVDLRLNSGDYVETSVWIGTGNQTIQGHSVLRWVGPN